MKKKNGRRRFLSADRILEQIPEEVRNKYRLHSAEDLNGVNVRIHLEDYFYLTFIAREVESEEGNWFLIVNAEMMGEVQPEVKYVEVLANVYPLIEELWNEKEEGSMVQLTTISMEREKEKEKEVFRELRKIEEEISAIGEDGFWLLRWKRYKGDTVVHVVSSREFEGNKETIPSAKDVHVVTRPGSKIPAEWFRYLKIVQR